MGFRWRFSLKPVQWPLLKWILSQHRFSPCPYLPSPMRGSAPSAPRQSDGCREGRWLRGGLWWFHPRSFPWMTVLMGSKSTIYSDFSHWKWWFSIVMLVYQRVLEYDYWLVVWNMAFIFFHILGIYIGNNNLNWRTHIFQRGGSTTNQIWCQEQQL